MRTTTLPEMSYKIIAKSFLALTHWTVIMINALRLFIRELIIKAAQDVICLH